MLIGNKNIKPKKGKGKNGPLELTIDMVYYLKKNVLKDNLIFTNAMYDESYKYLTSRGVNSMSVEGYLSHILDGHFDNILKEYEEYLISDANPRFETENNQLIVNGVNTKLQIKEVQKIIDNIPFGQSDDKLEKYIRKVADQYVFCKVECIRTIIDNYDNIVLDGILKGKGFTISN